MQRALGGVLALALGSAAAQADQPIVFGPYVPTPAAIVTRMLQIAKVGPDDFVIDLGSGDGRIPIAAAKEFGARGLGVDIDADLVAQSIENAKKAGVAFSAQAIGSMFGLYFRASPPASFAEVMQCDAQRFNRFFQAMLAQGVYFAPSAYEAGFVSAAHTPADVEATLAAARAAFSA